MMSNLWSDFWFKNKADIQIGYFRISFLLLTFLFYLFKLFDLDFLYTSDGIVRLEDLDLLINTSYKIPFFYFPETLFGIQLFFGMLFLGLVLGIIGVLPRLFFVPMLMIHLLFIYRNPTIVYGADMLISLGLFGLCLMGSGAPLLYSQKNKDYFLEDLRNDLSSMGVRLMQIQISLIYFFTALEKVRGASWWNGHALWDVFSNSQMMVLPLDFLGAFPTLVVLLTWSVIVFELVFSFALWTEAKYFFLILGGIFHFLIALSMGLWFFSFLILSFYPLFLSNPNSELNDYGLG